jgi:hypothetical protein
LKLHGGRAADHSSKHDRTSVSKAVERIWHSRELQKIHTIIEEGIAEYRLAARLLSSNQFDLVVSGKLDLDTPALSNRCLPRQTQLNRNLVQRSIGPHLLKDRLHLKNRYRNHDPHNGDRD